MEILQWRDQNLQTGFSLLLLCERLFYFLSPRAHDIQDYSQTIFGKDTTSSFFQDQSYPLSNFSVTSKVAEKVGESQGARGVDFLKGL